MTKGILKEGSCMRNAVLLSALLLSACTSILRAGGAPAEASATHPSEAATQPVPPQKPDTVDKQPAVPVEQSNTPPTLRKHNVESD